MIHRTRHANFTAAVASSVLAISFLYCPDAARAQVRSGTALENVRTAPLAKTGQTTSYLPGDDGAVQAGVEGHSPRFIDNQDGSITDRLTALDWLKNGGQYVIGWQNALNYCNNYRLGIPAGWRLPNIHELMSLLDFEQKMPMLPLDHPFTGIVSGVSYPLYLTSTTNSVYDSAADIYGVTLGAGDMRIWPKGGDGYVLCVRGK